MSFVQSNGIVERTGLWDTKALALLVVLVLSGGALLFAAGEAHAQQRPTPKAHVTVTGSERASVSESELAPIAIGTLPADSAPSQVGERGIVSPSGAEPYPTTYGASSPALKLVEQIHPGHWIDLLPEAAVPESFGATLGLDPALPESGLVLGPWYPAPFVAPPPAPGLGPALPYLSSTPEPAWGSLVPQAHKSLSSQIEEKPPVLSSAGTPKGTRQGSYQGNGVAEASPVEPLPPFIGSKASPPGLALQEPPKPPPVSGPSREAALLLSSAEAAANSAVETLQGAAADFSETLVLGDEASTETPSDDATEAPEDTPLPLSPVPLGSSYFSQSVGGQVGPGGVVPLLICVLVVGVVLLRPLVGRLSWATCELPRPSSLLLLPLERPG